MKKTKLLITSILMSMILLVSSCSPDTYSLDGATNKSDIDFDISQDLVVDPGGNTVILKNNTPGVILNWDYVTGKSNKGDQIVKYAFKGDYTIKITAVTDGGLVELDPVTVTVTEDNLSYVNDPLWNFLSGGVGKSKTWLLDLDANGVSKYFVGPLYFAGDELGWEKVCEGDAALCWTWDPEWKGNTWTGAKADHGTMTFSLDGGPFIKVEHKVTTPGTQNGTYFLDVAKHELTLSNAAILHSWGDNDIADWSNYKILTLTKDVMQIGAHNKAKAEYAVFNFISKEYSDNWVPKDVKDPNPTIDLNGGTVDDLLSTTTSTTKTWTLSKDSPFNYTNLEGEFLNTWNTVADYPGWASYIAADQAAVVKNKISFSTDGKVTTVDSNGVQKSGTYTTEAGTNIITFKDISPSFPIGNSWATIATTAENQWKIVKTAKTGNVVTDIWFGKRDPTKSEYMVFHFVLSN